jgi:sugar phosphate isomerase/epimerase
MTQRGTIMTINRRQFGRTLTSAVFAMATATHVRAQPVPGRKMTIDLTGGPIGVSGDQWEMIDLAARHGFESVEAKPQDLAAMNDGQRQRLAERLKEAGLVWGAAGLPVDFRGDEGRFRDDLRNLPRLMEGMQRAGASRVGTWLSPGHETLTYPRNFQQHARRLREVAAILKDRGQRFGLEYVGTFTARTGRRFPFIHTMAETAELIEEIGTGNVGFILDSWHWWTADETAADVLSLRNEQIVAVDLNDAPAGIAKREQRDNRRELPAATGVIDVAAFLGALRKIGYDGPVRAEPFNEPLRKLDNDAACAATASALQKAFASLP